MIIKFSPDLSEQEIYANGDELAQKMGLDKDEEGNRIYTHPKEEKIHVVTFNDPVLVTDNYKISRLEPSTLRDTVFALFASSIKTTEFNGTSVEFEQGKYDGVWGPSIDTLLFCKAMDQYDLRNAKQAIEIGCGSGFISKYLLDNTPNIEDMTLIDLNEYAITCSKDNIDDSRAKFFQGDAVNFIKEKKYDLIVCNPPYVPRPQSIDDNPYEGLRVLSYLMEHADSLLTENGRIITNFSSLCKPITDRIIDEEKIKVTELESMDVPFKIFNILNNPQWMNYLLKDGLRKENKDGYDYWHTISINEIKKA